ncbi:DUF3124 domain-containing protein [Streptomyces sp. TRM66268-LWL]|uniref:DUF3124 domain-containing protein n=1 Tax=Streptomyces polyasparticus TaxID=2767826 RepID=A0ABR7SVP9_9ACTN|nr:DUF3124 domain-containing protein [Streptomyces polyasparticus]MBC9719587.1 DUF3124 domain-containing protein [Streptomyces polyasparticus]
MDPARSRTKVLVSKPEQREFGYGSTVTITNTTKAKKSAVVKIVYRDAKGKSLHLATAGSSSIAPGATHEEINEVLEGKLADSAEIATVTIK